LGFHNCRHCGKEVEEEELYCPDCQALSGGRKTKKYWFISIFFSGILLALTGLLLWHGEIGSWNLPFGSILGKPVAVINGENISRADFQARLKSIRTAMEQQYGRDLFSGENGRTLLGNLEQRVLDGLLEERLVAQEARRLGIQISNEEVEKEVQRITQEVYGTRENFLAKLRERKVTQDELHNSLRNYLLYKGVKAAKALPGSDPEAYFNAWLMQAKQNAELAIYDFGEGAATTSSPSNGGCCGSGQSANGCMESSRAGEPLNAKTEGEAKKIALDTFQKANPSEKEVTARVTNYGCHVQVDIQKAGRVIKSYSYQGGKVFEIS